MANKHLDFAEDFLKLIFNGTAIPFIADNAVTTPLTDLYLSLHTADPLAGNQTTSEVDYTNYTRVAVTRDGLGWTVTNNSVSPTTLISFPIGGIGTSPVATHAAIGTDASGTGRILWAGAISPSIPCGDGITPRIRETSLITEI